ncbi:helix-turn-helix transcriptional regulator [Variovorax sp. IB41]|uniref:helix-turn-helix transcriptional regulator n=1 Tax=Variovorax sp. IB41 TaxID=2779370 RepID=UPI0018E88949|nr:AraC family transcriptional regulator [Variovorax sp. IB41]MBJ2154895.1 AraC family transcriptional regulator [Variovorax sp. IB41]
MNRSEVRRLRVFDLEQVRHHQDGQEWIPHWHDEWSFGAVVEGECRSSVAGRSILARAGDLIAIAPGIVHTGALTAHSNSASVLVMMLYVPVGWVEQTGLTGPACSGLTRAPALASEARHLCSPEAAQAWLRQAVPALARALRPQPSAASEAVPSEAVRALLGRVQSAVLGGEQTVAGLAIRCNVSRERIHRVLTQWIGMAPADYLRAVRLHRAKQMVLSGESVAAVAADCGFADQAHFTRWFRRTFGYTPGDLVQASLQQATALPGQRH